MNKNIIFDFDGVLVESVDIKTAAFRELFKHIPDNVEEITRFHIDNGGMSRFDKFRYIYARILKKLLPQYEFNKLCMDFSHLVVEKVVTVPSVKGAEEFLGKNINRYNMFVVSATPEEELKDIIRRRNLEKYFLGVYGSPAGKEKLLLKILKENNYSRAETVFLGDSANDYHAARKANIRFAARILDKEAPSILLEADIKFKDLFEFEEYLKS